MAGRSEVGMVRRVREGVTLMWTVGEMLAEQPCEEYTAARIAELWAGRVALSLSEILDLNIPAKDKVWVACRPGALPTAVCRAWLKRVCDRAIRAHALECGVPPVEAWARGWLEGKDRSQAAAAAWAAWAAWAAADAAAWAAWAAAAWAARAARAAEAAEE